VPAVGAVSRLKKRAVRSSRTGRLSCQASNLLHGKSSANSSTQIKQKLAQGQEKFENCLSEGQAGIQAQGFGKTV